MCVTLPSSLSIFSFFQTQLTANDFCQKTLAMSSQNGPRLSRLGGRGLLGVADQVGPPRYDRGMESMGLEE